MLKDTLAPFGTKPLLFVSVFQPLVQRHKQNESHSSILVVTTCEPGARMEIGAIP